MTIQTHYTPIAIRVEHLWVVKGGGLFANPKSLLQDVSFEVAPGTFCGIVGPNGAGKTTLFKAMIGEKPARGRIMLYKDDGSQADYESMYDNPEYWMQQIGYVPVDNVLHEDLTVRQALMHVGRLRIPGVDDDLLDAKIRTKLVELGFERDDERLERLVKNLSSGERKKANIVAELLTDPPLLLLDEPTSNLDPNAERDLMDSLKKLAGVTNNGNGPTILLITHTLDSLDRCNQVIFIENSLLRQNGTPQEVFERMEQAVIAEGHPVDTRKNDFERWAVIFDVFKTGERAQRDRKPPPPTQYPPAPPRHVPYDSFSRQLGILFSRYFLMRYNDLGGIFFILFAGFVAGFLLLIAPSDIFLETNDATAARQTVVLYTILIVIMGAFISHREISKEFRIYIHERAKGLNPLAYLVAKAIWMGVVIGFFATAIILALTGMQIARWVTLILGVVVLVIGVASTLIPNVMINRLSRMGKLSRLAQIALIAVPLIGASFVQLQNKELPAFPIDPVSVEVMVGITMVLASVASLTLGLMVSAAVGGNNDRATQLAIGVIVINVILAFSVLVIGSPEFQGFFDFLEPFAATHWGYRGFSSGISIYCWAGSPRFENFNSTGHIIMTWLLLLVHIVGAIGLGVFFLRMQETWTTRTRVIRAMFTQERGVYLLAILLVCAISWANFLSDQSYRYFELTFFDRLFGGNRYAYAENIPTATPMQLTISTVSSSYCGRGTLPVARDASDSTSDIPQPYLVAWLEQPSITVGGGR